MSKEEIRLKHEIFADKDGYVETYKWKVEKAMDAYHLEQSKKLVEALNKINQMSDSGNAETAVVRMKEIASEALKQFNK